MTMTKTLAIAMVLGVTACGGETEPTEQTSAAVSASLEGTYDFVLEQSDVAAKLRAKCAGDAACWEAIEKDAQSEKIRFSRNAAGQMVFTSFSIEASKEEVFLETPVALREVSPNLYRGKVIGWPKGTLVAQLTHARAEMSLERRADGTIAVVDEKKGRLVYRRAS